MNSIRYVAVNLSVLEALAESGVTEITPAILLEKRIIRDAKDLVKVLGGGEITKSVKVLTHAISAEARTKIEKAGGSVTILSRS